MTRLITLGGGSNQEHQDRSVAHLRHFMCVLNGNDPDGQVALVALQSGPGEAPAGAMWGEDETLYVVEGALTVHTEHEEVLAMAGDFVAVPRGTSHWLTKETDDARLLVLFSAD